MSGREISRYFSVNIVAYAYRNLVQVAKYVKYGKCHISSTLQTASVFGSHTVEPSHSSRTSGSCTILSAVSAAASQLICFLTEDLADKCTCSYCTGVCLAYSDDLFDLIRRNTCSDGTVSCQCGRRGNHRVNSMIRILQGSQLSFQQNVLSFFDGLPQICGYVTCIRLHHLLVAHEFFVDIILFERFCMIQILKKYIFLQNHIGNSLS